MLAEPSNQLVAAVDEILDVRAHFFGQLGGIVAEPLDELAAIDFHGAIELGEMAGDQLAQRVAVLRDLLGEFRTAAGEHVGERF
jgi:hypothetical protein